ncbi:MAG TPA: ribosome maturation factor RimM [Bacteroidia bacterium]|nr:ribosome maturation factor RimM [Bacteroidia bacterium]
MSQLIKLGKLARVHGLKGALVVVGDNLQDVEIKKTGFLFIEMNNVPTPFFITEVKYIGKNLVLSFDGIKTIEEAKPLIGKELWGDEKNISVKKSNTNNLQGYDLIDEIKGNVGKVNELIVLPKQQFLSVQVNDDEVLLPYTDAFVKKIDHKAKLVYYCAPEGLFDIN